MRCKTCGFLSKDVQDFIIDYVWSEEDDDEISVCQCPNCGESDEELLVDWDE